MGKLHATRDENCKRKREKEKREKRGKHWERAWFLLAFCEIPDINLASSYTHEFPGKRGLSCIIYKAEEAEEMQGEA